MVVKKSLKSSKKVTKKASKKSTAKKSSKKSITKKHTRPMDKKIEYIISPSKVQAKRMELALSQVEVSDMVGLTRIHYGNIEKGIAPAREIVAIKVSEALGSSVKSLFKKLENGKFLADK